jgi:hypothetical protein
MENIHSKFVPPGPAYLAPNPVVTHTEDRRKGINFPTTANCKYKVNLCESLHTWLDFWDNLDGGRSSTNYSDSFPCQVIRAIPNSTVHQLSSIFLDPGKIWVLVGAKTQESVSLRLLKSNDSLENS